MRKIVECIPNFSDGRRPEVYGAIEAAIGMVPGVHLLGVSPDADHNRTVITFAGEPDSVAEAAFRAIETAARLIDLEEHRGEHPRIGATDVCPFVPVSGISEEECVQLARSLAERVGKELGIATYLYGSAATSPERVRLASIRKGQYEKWRDEVGRVPSRQPDFGPAEPRPWGATVIGVRPFLIAYNIYLNSDDVELADEIARKIRYSSGGLPFVQAKGFLVEGTAQVSMNLTNFRKTPIHTVQELVRREAEKRGLSITRAELIGLAPQDALLDAAATYLQLEGPIQEKVLESRLAEAAAQAEADLTPRPFIDAVAAGTPTPGGGSVAALAGALAAALTVMVSNLTIGRKKYADYQEEATTIRQRATELGQELTAAVGEDSEAFMSLMAAWKDKSLSGDARQQAIESATLAAAEIPLRVARCATDVGSLALRIATIGNANAATDAASAGFMARAAVQAAALNVRVNARDMTDRARAGDLISEVERLQLEASATADEIARIAAARGDF